MNGVWFDPNHWAWLPGTVFGCLVGLWGTLAGVFGPRGQARSLVVGFGLLLLAAAAVLLVAALIALRGGQPYGVWFALLLPGAQGVLILGPLFPLVLKRYRQAEERRMQAEDFQQSTT